MTIWNRLYHWFDAPAPLASLACVRIGLGLIGLSAYLLYFPYMELMFGVEGMARYFDWYGPAKFSATYLWFVYVVLLISTTCFTLGYRTRIAGLLLMLCHASFVEQSAYFSWGWTRLFVVFTLFTALSPSGARYSLDEYLRRKRGEKSISEKETTSWATRILQIHVYLVYLSAGWSRIFDPGWLRGEMLYEALAFDMYSRFPHLALQSMKPLLWLGSHASLIIEVTAPVLLLIPKLRPYSVLALMLLHFLLHVSATVGWWQMMMISALFVLLPNSWTKKLLESILPKPKKKSFIAKIFR